MRTGLIALVFLTTVACKGGDKTQSSATAPSAPAAATVVAPSSAGLAARASAGAAVATMIDGSKLLPAFPPVGMDGAATKQERPTKEGFAEVVYKKGADDVATITITDTTAVPAVRDDYKGAKENVGGSPLKESGKFKSSILVGDRYQVQIQSPRLKPEQRKVWLEKVDRTALAALR